MMKVIYATAAKLVLSPSEMEKKYARFDEFKSLLVAVWTKTTAQSMNKIFRLDKNQVAITGLHIINFFIVT